MQNKFEGVPELFELSNSTYKGKVVLVSLNAKYIHSNLAIRYLEAYYKEHKYKSCPIVIQRKEFTINQQVSQIVADLYSEKADIIGFSCYIWNVDMVMQIIRNLKKVAPRTTFVMGGPEVSFDAHEVIREYPEIDYIICGEGEYAFTAVVEHSIQNICNLDTTLKNESLPKNVCYRDSKTGEIIPALEQGRVANISDIPSPYEDGFDSEEFAHRIVYYETSRGCPYSCQYCLSSAEQGVRFFPMDRVKRDLQLFIEAGVRQVKFVDRTFNCAPQYAFDLFQWIVDNHQGKTNFHFEISADLLKEDTLAFLQTVPKGLFQFEIGVQSTHEPTLAEIQRKTDFDKLQKAVKQIRDYGNIHQHLDLIVGLPYEGYQQFANSFNDVYELQPDKLQMGFLKALKGAGIRQRAEEYGFIYTTEAPYEVMQTTELSYSEMIQLKGIEHMVDHYYNSHQFDQSLQLLLREQFQSPFAMYEAFADYCKQEGLFDRAHSQAAMYDALYCFAKEQRDEERFLVLLKETMKFDFVRVSPHGKLPDCLSIYQPDEFKKQKQAFLSNPDMADKFFPQHAELNMRNKSKRMHVEVFCYDVMGSKEEQDTYYLFMYLEDPLLGKRGDWYDVTSDFMEIAKRIRQG